MKKAKEQNHLQAWRLFRKMTQEQLAEAVGTNKAVISLIESGDRQLSPKWLGRLAPALGTTRGFLLDYHPDDVDADYLREIMEMPKDRRAQATALLRVLRTGTNG